MPTPGLRFVTTRTGICDVGGRTIFTSGFRPLVSFGVGSGAVTVETHVPWYLALKDVAEYVLIQVFDPTFISDICTPGVC